MSDGFLRCYKAYTDFDWYPANFHAAMGRVLVGLAVGRKAWLMDGRWAIYPLGHYIMVADSGVGKGACVEVMYRVQRAALPGLQVARKEGSAAGILNRLPLDSAGKRQTSPLLIEAGEMTTLLNRMEHLGNIVSVLTELADNNEYGKSLKDGHRNLTDIQTSMVLGTNEKALREHFTASVIETGLASRFTWLTAHWAPKPLGRASEDDPLVLAARDRAVESLRGLCGLSGPLHLDPEAVAWFASWQEANDQQPPPDRGLSGYWSRRYIHLLRAALVSALADSRMEVSVADMSSAWDWVQETQAQMYEAFGSLRLSPYGVSEERVAEYVAQHPGVTWTALCREFSGQFAGKDSVARVVDSLKAAGRLAESSTPRGGGRMFTAVAS